MAAEIRHTLDLCLRLVDTTSGRLITGKDVRLLRDGKPILPLEKGDSSLVLLGVGRIDFDLTVRTAGFDTQSVRVAYADLDPMLPHLDLHLIPGRDYRSPSPCLSLEGTRPGITALSAVRAGDDPCFIRAFDPRKKLLTLFNPHKLSLERTHYALVDPGESVFEPFCIVKHLSDHEVKIDRVLETAFNNHFPIAPIVFGAADSDGAYRLRVRDDSTKARWFIRWEEGKTVSFQTVDFHDPETCILMTQSPQ